MPRLHRTPSLPEIPLSVRAGLLIPGSVGAHVGDLIVSELDDDGVDTSMVIRSPDARSSYSSVYVDRTGERQIVNYRGAGLSELDVRGPDLPADVPFRT